MRPSEQESGVWSRRLGFKATIVGEADLEVQIKVEVEGNLNGVTERRSGSLDYMGGNNETSSGILSAREVDLERSTCQSHMIKHRPMFLFNVLYTKRCLKLASRPVNLRTSSADAEKSFKLQGKPSLASGNNLFRSSNRR
jgi:hypothetical protein